MATPQRIWPTRPLIDHLTGLLGEYHCTENPTGYCSINVGALLGIHGDSWLRIIENHDRLTDKQADQFATRLGGIQIDLWPDWFDYHLTAADRHELRRQAWQALYPWARNDRDRLVAS